jgi:hypothetical protein
VLGGVRGEVLGVDFLGILRDVARGGPRLAAPGARRGDVRVEEAGRKSRRVRTVAVAAATSPEGFLFLYFFRGARRRRIRTTDVSERRNAFFERARSPRRTIA